MRKAPFPWNKSHADRNSQAHLGHGLGKKSRCHVFPLPLGGRRKRNWERVARRAYAHAIHLSPALFVDRLEQILGYESSKDKEISYG